MILIFIVCLIASTIGAISGIGGGVIIKPVLDATGLMTVSTISFLSGITVLTMSCVSLIRSRNNGIILEKSTTTPLAIGSAVGGVIGKLIFDVIGNIVNNDNIVGAIQSIILLLLTLCVFMYVKFKNRLNCYNIKNVFSCIIIGLSLGIISSFLGIGGGPLNIAILYYFFSMDPKTSSKNSLYIILFSQIASLLLTIFTGSVPEFSYVIMLLMIIGGVSGALIGSSIVKRVKNNVVENVFMFLMIIIIMINIYNIINFLS